LNPDAQIIIWKINFENDYFTVLRNILHIILLILLALRLPAQPRQYVFNRLSSREGLASNFVYTIFQDKKGFMWFGTANGLQRYDGRKIIRFTPPPGSTEYLPPVSISQMFEDKKGNIWVRSGKEVGIFDPATFRFKRAVITPGKEVNPRSTYKLWQNSEGQVFLVITKFGLLAYDSLANSFTSQNAPHISAPDKWSITTIIEDPASGNYWLGCDSGLALYNTTENTVYSRHYNPDNLPILNAVTDPRAVNVLFIDQSNRLWITDWNTAKKQESTTCYDLTTRAFTSDTSGLNLGPDIYREMHGFAQHSSGGLWAFGRMHLFSYDPKLRRFNFIRNEHLEDYGIKYDYVFSMYEDKEHNLWLGTDQGVYAVNPTENSFNTVKAEVKGKPADISITNFLETADRQLFVSTWGSGLISYDHNFWQTKNSVNAGVPNAEDNFLMQWDLFEQQPENKLWIGCQSGRIIVHDIKTKKNLYFNPPVFEDKTIRQIIGAEDGNIWFGSQYGHLVKWNSRAGNINNLEKELVPVANLGTVIYKLYEDKQGFIWAATHEFGLHKIDPTNGKTVAIYSTGAGKGKSLYSNVVTDIVPYNDSTLIIASGAINFLNINTGKIRQVSSDDGLPSNTVNSIEYDQNGSLWISLLSGLCRYNIPKNIFTSYSQRDGIFYDNFQIGASLRLPSGSMLFGNTHDFVAFDPEKKVSSQIPPDVSITDFKLFNNYVPPDSILALDEVKLDYTQNSITIEFAALSFLQKDKIVYYYKLDGIDKETYRTDRLLLANYTQLPPGSYTFKVWCENGDGIRSRGVTNLKVHISPPFWNTWWFMVLMASFVAGLVYLVHRIKVNRLLDMEKVRRRIARDLHDDMGSTLSTINILSEMAKMKVSSDTGKTKEYIDKISDNSSRMMEAMDDIVWSINPMNDSMQKVAARMREFATGVFEAKNIEYSFKVDEAVHDVKLDMEARRDLFLLFKEAVNNLAKYSKSKWAEVDIRVVKSSLIMTIKDEGIGFNNNAEVDGGNGLVNMKKRAQSLRGKLEIRSEVNKGTVITLDAPVN
jgi:ligand-binding sensor domain-containing protein/two-component sensor histidine kinase